MTRKNQRKASHRAGKKTSSKLVSGDVDSRLGHVSNRQLDQLTRVLFRDPALNRRKWVKEQGVLMKRLDGRFLRPKGLTSRLAMRMAKHGVPFTLAQADLCRLHNPLDPRLIRKLSTMVDEEFAEWPRKLRRREVRLKDESPLGHWLDRMDEAKEMWLCGELSDKHEGAWPRMGRWHRGRGCEACLLAAVGRNFEAVRDLTVSVTTRQRYMAARWPGYQTPPLLRVLKSWRKLYPEETRQALTRDCERLAGDIMQLLRELRAEREARKEEKRSLWVLLGAAGLRDHSCESLPNGRFRFHPRRARQGVLRDGAGSNSQPQAQDDMGEQPQGEAFCPPNGPMATNAGREATCQNPSQVGEQHGTPGKSSQPGQPGVKATAAQKAAATNTQSHQHGVDAAGKGAEPSMNGQGYGHEANCRGRAVDATPRPTAPRPSLFSRLRNTARGREDKHHHAATGVFTGNRADGAQSMSTRKNTASRPREYVARQTQTRPAQDTKQQRAAAEVKRTSPRATDKSHEHGEPLTKQRLARDMPSRRGARRPGHPSASSPGSASKHAAGGPLFEPARPLDDRQGFRFRTAEMFMGTPQPRPARVQTQDFIRRRDDGGTKTKPPLSQSRRRRRRKHRCRMLRLNILRHNGGGYHADGSRYGSTAAAEMKPRREEHVTRHQTRGHAPDTPYDGVGRHGAEGSGYVNEAAAVPGVGDAGNGMAWFNPLRMFVAGDGGGGGGPSTTNPPLSPNVPAMQRRPTEYGSTKEYGTGGGGHVGCDENEALRGGTERSWAAGVEDDDDDDDDDDASVRTGRPRQGSTRDGGGGGGGGANDDGGLRVRAGEREDGPARGRPPWPFGEHIVDRTGGRGW
ncbi:hypothetical protein JDV02_000659 [Purpureocillium takamizusanense]|uniref:Uncharacterized protein n=1 Tax=Purpureocillium takamizusanense TaxID=2060973 RepID=A0A9Q8Q5A3_9HYPO|nr:uncharacterized protein JDV02_000659 [Purpureocillium takamizusanense]UNI13974.1 hypothetical protein JDV02_000659 [Purpureocillium takamizusanense]